MPSAVKAPWCADAQTHQPDASSVETGEGMSKPPTAALNEVLLRAALRAERINHDRLLDGDASQQARRNDNSAILYRHRVPAASPENAHGRTPKSMDHREQV